MKTYTGTRAPDGCLVTVHEDDGIMRELPLRLDLRNHSPTGFEWGYPGSGPAQLSLALAADVLGDDDQAQDVYQDLKFKVIARLPHDHWRLTEDQLRQAIQQIQQRGQARTP
jgi:Family of unknown function (DUF6166)